MPVGETSLAALAQCRPAPALRHRSATFDAAVESMLSLGTILDRKMVYWDVRP